MKRTATLALAAMLAACGGGDETEDAEAEAAAGAEAAMEAEAEMDAEPEELPVAETPDIEFDSDATPAERMAAESRAFLEANAARPEVTALPSGLQYSVVTAAPDGAESPTLNDWVCVHYTGALADGSVFDSSRASDDAAPIVLPLSGLITGWREAIPMMGEGDRWMLYIPPEMGYGAAGAAGAIPPNAALVFDIELFKALAPTEIAVTPAGRPDPNWNCAEGDMEDDAMDGEEMTDGEPAEE